MSAWKLLPNYREYIHSLSTKITYIRTIAKNTMKTVNQKFCNIFVIWGTIWQLLASKFLWPKQNFLAQITQRTNQYTICQHTNYHNTTNHHRYLIKRDKEDMNKRSCVDFYRNSLTYVNIAWLTENYSRNFKTCRKVFIFIDVFL